MSMNVIVACLAFIAEDANHVGRCRIVSGPEAFANRSACSSVTKENGPPGPVAGVPRGIGSHRFVEQGRGTESIR